MSSSLGLCASFLRGVGLDFRGISRIITNIRRHRLIPELQDRFCGSRSDDVQYQHRCSHEVSRPSAGALKPHALLEFREANATLYSQPLRITHASHCACIRSVNLAQQGADFPASPDVRVQYAAMPNNFVFMAFYFVLSKGASQLESINLAPVPDVAVKCTRTRSTPL